MNRHPFELGITCVAEYCHEWHVTVWLPTCRSYIVRFDRVTGRRIYSRDD